MGDQSWQGLTVFQEFLRLCHHKRLAQIERNVVQLKDISTVQAFSAYRA
jgi:hypothetical protein